VGAGDPGMLVADSSKLTRQLGWSPRHGDIDEIVKSAYAWEKRLA
jgi:UDP-glucose 4-epimerase